MAAGLAGRIVRLQPCWKLVSGFPGEMASAHRIQSLRGYRHTVEMDDADLLETDSKRESGRGSRPRSLDVVDSQLGGTESLSDWGKGHEREQPPRTPQEKCLNQVTLLGRVGQDPQIRGSQAKPVTTFSLATNSVWRTEEFSEWQTKTEWHRVAVFKPSLQDAVYNFLSKGSRVHVSGRIMYGEITNQEGVKHKTTTIAAEEIIFLGKSGNARDL